jgi:hypothetical protein
VRDTVNFLQYASDPTQVERQGLGIWVVLFLSCSRHRVHVEEGILEGRPLTYRAQAFARFRGRALSVEAPCHDDAVLGAG